jgi:hypothetical protein
MICFATRKEGESNEKLILRYKKAFFQTRTANKLKKSKTHAPELSPRRIREKAIIREYYRSMNRSNSGM